MKLKCLVVDDEPIAQEIIVNFIEKVDFLVLSGTAYDAMEALRILHKFKIDLLFLDIKMPVLSGLDLLKSLANPPAVILTTAFSEYALESYDFGVKDYLLKPIAFDRFLKAVNKVIAGKEPQNEKQVEAATEVPKFIFFKSDKKFFRFYFEEILFIEGSGNYVKVHTATQKPILVLDKLSHLEKSLGNVGFIRTHKSFMVNLQHVKEIAGNRIIIHGVKVPIGASYRESVFKIINI